MFSHDTDGARGIADEQIEHQRCQIVVDAKRLGGEEGALHLHETLHPYYWGISWAQFRRFLGLVTEGVAKGSIENFTEAHLPQYAQERFDNLGPNVYQVM